ncbi:HAD-IIB family hydrolase [Culicoidibacter larvae]|uniref:HAD-IIB family hydrolase n=1 Tax=Culicoidibacter larvae TaxID=2579976 RepID=A0A5R8QC99_9FIRM|nr:HAD-IIB family hydrolase [Culicoidibacter larvae]TLG74199.1 HAD-IIB family hydrolase [Culicoidibacter larvae]
MKKITHLFSDLDGTLFVDEQVYRKDVEAIHAFIASGGEFHVATGRTDIEILNLSIEEHVPVHFRVSNNGATVVTPEDGKIFERLLPKPATKFIADFISENYGLFGDIECTTPDLTYFLYEPEDWVLSYKADSYKIDPEVIHKLGHSIDSIKFFIAGQEDVIERMVHHFDTDFKDTIAYFNDINAVNIVPANVSKGTGINRILHDYKINRNQIAVIGDAANDIPMFGVTPHSFTFTRSKQFVKDTAQYHVNSVADAIERIMAYNERVDKR